MKKKGFTLIELLAVIVVLAIIALIAVPLVLNSIEKAREGAAIESARTYVNEVEKYMILAEMDSSKIKLEQGKTYQISNETYEEVSLLDYFVEPVKASENSELVLNDIINIKGTIPSSGTITIGEKKKVSSATMSISGYIVSYDGNTYVIEGKDGSVRVTDIELNETSVDIFVGDNFTVTATVKPDDASNKYIKWTSADESIVTVNKGVITGVSKGQTVIYVQSGSVKKEITVNVVEPIILADVVSVGDYVAYDAGVWEETVAKSTSKVDTLSGYTEGVNRGNSVKCNEYTTQLKGWRVLKVDTDNDIVTLVHAGIPECYYWQKDTVQTSLVNRGQIYLNNDYATEAHIMSSDEAIAITGSTNQTTNDLRYIGKSGTSGANATYWLYKETEDRYNNNNVGVKGQLDRTYAADFGGIRPIVTLKAGIKTSGQGTDVVGNENSWILIKPAS